VARTRPDGPEGGPGSDHAGDRGPAPALAPLHLTTVGIRRLWARRACGGRLSCPNTCGTTTSPTLRASLSRRARRGPAPPSGCDTRPSSARQTLDDVVFVGEGSGANSRGISATRCGRVSTASRLATETPLVPARVCRTLRVQPRRAELWCYQKRQRVTAAGSSSPFASPPPRGPRPNRASEGSAWLSVPG
jgi:hypothetical protein